jgi:hypothetical protein
MESSGSGVPNHLSTDMNDKRAVRSGRRTPAGIDATVNNDKVVHTPPVLVR